MTRIFISYSRDDAHTVKKLAELLGKAYDHIWYDTSEIRGGDKWGEKIEQAIEDCDHFIFLLSEASLKSEWCIKEFDKASELDKHIVPVKIRRSLEIPEELNHLKTLHQIEMLGDISADAISEIFAGIIKSHYSQTFAISDVEIIWQIDLQLLNEIWIYISTNVMERLQSGIFSTNHILYDFYREHIWEYSYVRERPEKRFRQNKLENAFKQFDISLQDFDTKISNSWFLGEKINEERYLIPRYKLSTDKAAYENNSREHDLSVESYKMLKQQHKLLVDCIIDLMPIYLGDKEVWQLANFPSQTNQTS